jgi:serine/threonine-protein kinase
MKILNGGVPDEHQAAERFEREARLVKKMRHPNIISVFDFGKMADGRSYFVMEFVEGLSLLSVLESEYKLSMTRTCKIILQVCDAMAHAHQLGIIHRDLKPSNVILVSEDDKCDKVKIVDFGIAKLNEPWEGMESRLTQDGQVLGSPAYMSPEQCLGNPLDQRSDIYSVGCVMYQLLCGVPPFWGDHALAILYKQVNEATTAVDLPSEPISPGLEKIILKTLRKDPNDRYQSMTELESDLVKLMMLQEARAQ